VYAACNDKVEDKDIAHDNTDVTHDGAADVLDDDDEADGDSGDTGEPVAAVLGDTGVDEATDDDDDETESGVTGGGNVVCASPVIPMACNRTCASAARCAATSARSAANAVI